jgi:hypothetical protein
MPPQSQLSVSHPVPDLESFRPGRPLWQRVPTRDEDGSLLSDFMMVIPKLNKQSPDVIRQTVENIGLVLGQYPETVVFADLNLKINILWVSVRAVPGICLELPALIHHAVPAARLVGEKRVL